jgi:hypothetical protein
MDPKQLSFIDHAEKALHDLSSSRTAARRVNQAIDDELRSLCLDLIAEVGKQELRLSRAHEILGRLSKCWRLDDEGEWRLDVGELYSTRTAAEAALKQVE